MKLHRYGLLGGMLLSLSISTTVQAEFRDKEYQAGLFGAYQDLADLDNGGGGGLKYGVMWTEVYEKIDLGCDVRLSGLTGYEAGADINAYPLEFTGIVRKPLGETTRLYSGPGIGYYWFDKDNGAANLDDGIGFYAVLGLEQTLAEGWILAVEAKYLYVDTDATGVGVRKVDDVTGVGASVGLAYQW